MVLVPLLTPSFWMVIRLPDADWRTSASVMSAKAYRIQLISIEEPRTGFQIIKLTHHHELNQSPRPEMRVQKSEPASLVWLTLRILPQVPTHLQRTFRSQIEGAKHHVLVWIRKHRLKPDSIQQANSNGWLLWNLLYMGLSILPHQAWSVRFVFEWFNPTDRPHSWKWTHLDRFQVGKRH